MSLSLPQAPYLFLSFTGDLLKGRTEHFSKAQSVQCVPRGWGRGGGGGGVENKNFKESKESI